MFIKNQPMAYLLGILTGIALCTLVFIIQIWLT